MRMLLSRPRVPTAWDYLPKRYPNVDWHHVLSVLNGDPRTAKLIDSEKAYALHRVTMGQVLQRSARPINESTI